MFGALEIDAFRVNDARGMGDIPRNRQIVDNSRTERGYLDGGRTRYLLRSSREERVVDFLTRARVDNLLTPEALRRSPGRSLGSRPPT